MRPKYKQTRHPETNKITTEHLVKIAAILGRPLKGSECVHHVNENGEDNTNSNLVVCPNNAYHKLLHIRTKALAACGNANYRRCHFCKKWDDPEAMINRKRRSACGMFVHRSCFNEYSKNLYIPIAKRRK